MQPGDVFRRRAAVLLFSLVLSGVAAQAQTPPATPPGPSTPARPAPAQPAGSVVIPRYSDPRARVAKPDLPTDRIVKWATGDDYPPFHYADADGQPAGFAVDLARAICAELALACTLQAWRWDALLDTVDRRQADVILAMLRPTPTLRARFAMTERVHQTPARFVARADKALPAVTPEALKGRTVAVVAGSAHEAFLKAFYPGVTPKPFPRGDDARAAVKDGAADAVFGDAVALAFWLNGAASEACCGFVGGPFSETRYFGEGVGALLKPGDDKLRQAIDYALQRLDENGVYAEIYLRHFPVGIW